MTRCAGFCSSDFQPLLAVAGHLDVLDSELLQTRRGSARDW